MYVELQMHALSFSFEPVQLTETDNDMQHALVNSSLDLSYKSRWNIEKLLPSKLYRFMYFVD